MAPLTDGRCVSCRLVPELTGTSGRFVPVCVFDDFLNFRGACRLSGFYRFIISKETFHALPPPSMHSCSITIKLTTSDPLWWSAPALMFFWSLFMATRTGGDLPEETARHIFPWLCSMSEKVFWLRCATAITAAIPAHHQRGFAVYRKTEQIASHGGRIALWIEALQPVLKRRDPPSYTASHLAMFASIHTLPC